MNLEREWDKTYYLKNAGLEVDAVMQEDGTVTAESIDPAGETIGISDVFGGGVKPDIYSLSEAAGAPVTEKEVGGTQAGALMGVPGALVTGVQDLGGLLYGGLQALLAEEGQGVEEFIKGFSAISGAIGSEKAGELFGGVVDALPIDDETKEAMKRGYLAGEFASMGLVGPKLAKAGAGAVADYAAGAPARLKDAKSGVNLGMGVDPTQMVDEAIVGAQKALQKPTKENPVTAVPPTETEPGIIAFHGSGADFDQFSLEKIGTGEGEQAYGYGLYFTDSEDIAKFYRDTVSRRQDSIPQSVPDAPENIAGELALDINFNKGVFGDTKQLQINSADPDYDFYIQTLDDNAVETTQSGALKTFEFRDGSIISLLDETMPVFNGKALDSVYTSDVQDVFGAEIADVAQRAKDMGIPGTLEELTDDVTTVLSQLGQGLSSKRDMSAAVESLAPSGQGAPSRFKTIYNHFIEPKSTIETTSTVTELGVKKGKMYKVGLEPKPEDMLDYEKSISEQSQKVQDALYANEEIASIIKRKRKEDGLPPEFYTGEELYADLAENLQSPQAASNELADAGILGLKYTAAGSRGANIDAADVEKNYVIFDDKAIKILEKYGIVGPVAITALGAAKQEGADDGDL